MLQRCLTHLKWPITLFPRFVQLSTNASPFLSNAITRVLSRAASCFRWVCSHCSIGPFGCARCEQFSARQRKAVTAQQKLNCILQLHIEKLNVENCCHSWRQSSRSEPVFVFFLHVVLNFWHTFHTEIGWRNWSRRMVRKYTKGIGKSFLCRGSFLSGVGSTTTLIEFASNTSRNWNFGRNGWVNGEQLAVLHPQARCVAHFYWRQ